MAISLQVASAVRVTVRGTAYLPSPLLTLESETRAAASATAAAASAVTSASEADEAAASAAAAAATAASLSSALASTFVTSTASSDLANEVVLTDTASVTWDRTTPGQMKANATASLADGAVTAVKLATSALGSRSGMVNGTLVQSRASSAETFAVKTLAGTDPTASDPVYFVFQTGSGAFVVRTVTAALSVTASSGSTLGAVNSVPFRIWCVAADDAGTVKLAIVNCRSGNSVLPLDEFNTASATAEGGAGAADSAQILYSSAAFTSKYLCLVGYGEWDAGLAAAGTWGTAPTRTIQFTSAVARPGQATGRRTVATTTTIDTGTTSTTYVSSAFSGAITLSSPSNIVQGYLTTNLQASGGNGVEAQMVRGSTSVGSTAVASPNSISNVGSTFLDFPGATGAQTYTLQRKTNVAATTVFCPYQNTSGAVCATLILEEIMA